MKKLFLTLLSAVVLMPTMASNNVAPWGWATCSDEAGTAFTLSGGCFTDAKTTTLTALGGGQTDDNQIKQAIAQNDIIVFDGSNGDFILNEYVSIGSKNKTLIGINDARLCTKFYLTADDINYLKQQNLEGLSSTKQYTGTLPDGTEITCDERAFFTKKAMMELQYQKTGVYSLPNKSGIFYIETSADNIIIRNLSLIGPGSVDIDGSDLITNQGQHVWIDHCTFVDSQDGALDSKRCDWATYTYNYFYYTSRSYSHAYTCGCGWADGQMTLHLTFASNIWGAGCVRRLPQCGDCYVHLVNNYHNCPGNSVGIAINDGCKALVENNYAASGVNSPLTGSGSNRNVTVSGNNYSATGVGSTVTVPYQYSKITAANVPANLTGEEGAGATLGNDASYILSTIPTVDRGSTSLATWYAITGGDGHVSAGGIINEVDGITMTFSNIDWTIGGSGSDAQEVDGVALTGKYATTASNGNPVTFTTTKAGTLTIFFGGGIATNKKVYMTEGENGLTGKVLSTDAEVENGTAPNPAIEAWDGLVYTLETGKSYEFKATGTKWRLAGFRYISTATGITAPKSVKATAATTYNLAGQKVEENYKGIVIKNGKKILQY
jgi:pectate lyase